MKKDKEIRLATSLDDLLKKLDKSINFLSIKYRIRGYQADDLKQIMFENIIKYYAINKDKGIDWWFIKLDWLMKEVYRSEKKKPLNNYTSLQSFYSI